MKKQAAKMQCIIICMCNNLIHFLKYIYFVIILEHISKTVLLKKNQGYLYLN